MSRKSKTNAPPVSPVVPQSDDVLDVTSNGAIDLVHEQDAPEGWGVIDGGGWIAPGAPVEDDGGSAPAELIDDEDALLVVRDGSLVWESLQSAEDDGGSLTRDEQDTTDEQDEQDARVLREGDLGWDASKHGEGADDVDTTGLSEDEAKRAKRKARRLAWRKKRNADNVRVVHHAGNYAPLGRIKSSMSRVTYKRACQAFNRGGESACREYVGQFLSPATRAVVLDVLFAESVPTESFVCQIVPPTSTSPGRFLYQCVDDSTCTLVDESGATRFPSLDALCVAFVGAQSSAPATFPSMTPIKLKTD